MANKLKILAVIPARGKSKRLPGKNIKLLAGKPLIVYSIQDALNSKLIDRVIVSTDDPKIAKVARRYGAEVPFLRPKELAGDRVSDAPVFVHVLEWLRKNENYRPDFLLFLRPTTPLRRKGLIDNCIKKIVSTGCDGVRSVRKVGHWHPYWMLQVDKSGKAREFLKGKTVDRYYQSQLLPPLYKHDGYCDIIRASNLPKTCSPKLTLKGFYGKDRRVVLNEDPYFINIDTPAEFAYAESILKNKNIKSR